MPKAKLDSTFCLLAHCEHGKKKTDYWDSQVTGFVLECRSSGTKTYALRYIDSNGVQRQHKIGGYADVTFDQARKAARLLRSEVVLGGNPAAQKESRKVVPYYAVLAQQHLDHAQTYQRSFDTTEMYMRRHIMPRWGKVRLDDIGQQDVAKWLANKTAEGLALATVEKIRAIFGRSFELAVQWNVPGVTRNPTHGIKRPPLNNARDRSLNPAEARRLQLAVMASQNTQLKYIVGLLLLTGARVTELLTAEWKHVDVDRKIWLIPTSKTGKARHVPLSQAAIDIIEQLPQFDGRFLLPNPKTLQPYTGIKRPWQTARDAAGLPGLRIHDLRHAAASAMVSAGIDLFAVGRVLGHADHKSTMRYSHLANDTLMAAVEAGAAGLKVDWSRPVQN